jgi:hypothetical protein
VIQRIDPELPGVQYRVSWGDHSRGVPTSRRHTYEDVGRYTIEVRAEVDGHRVVARRKVRIADANQESGPEADRYSGAYDRRGERVASPSYLTSSLGRGRSGRERVRWTDDLGLVLWALVRLIFGVLLILGIWAVSAVAGAVHR